MRAVFGESRSARSAVCSILFAVLVLIVMVSISYASSEGGEEHGSNLMNFVWRLVNFVLLVYFLYKFSKDKIKDFFAGRQEDIKAAIEGAAVAKEEAEKKFKEYSEKLAKATDEIDQISEMIKSQGYTEKEKIIEGAKISAAKMKEDAQARLEQDLKTARNQLRADAAELSVKLAEDVLVKTVKENDHDAMVKDFLNRMVQRN